jgi:hypothetical protein
MFTPITRRFYSATSRTMATKNLQVGWVSRAAAGITEDQWNF